MGFGKLPRYRARFDRRSKSKASRDVVLVYGVGGVCYMRFCVRRLDSLRLWPRTLLDVQGPRMHMVA